MEIGKVVTARPEFKEFQKGSVRLHFFSEVLLIDKSSGNTRPLVFQLKDEMRPSLENIDRLQNFSGRFEDAFIFAGELLEIEPEKKIVRLVNNLVYSYGRLITATTHMSFLEISTLLHALKNALLLETLRIQQKMQGDELAKEPSHSFTRQMSPGSQNNEIDKIVQPCMDSNAQSHECPDISSSSKTLCQVQL